MSQIAKGDFVVKLLPLEMEGLTTDSKLARMSINKSKSGESTKRAEEMDAKIDKPERLHGRHVLNRYEDGMEKCIGCELCAGVCPANCITIVPAESPDGRIEDARP